MALKVSVDGRPGTSEWLEIFLGTVAQELRAAYAEHAPIHSAHEGYGVILEELDEFWEEVRKRRALRDPKQMYRELVQLAAMAARTAVDLHLDDERRI